VGYIDPAALKLPLPDREPASYSIPFDTDSECGLRPPMEDVMRAEIQNIVDEIKQSVVLLRRHL
jgi:hypothetical protein